MLSPSSDAATMEERAFENYLRLGGDSIHLHGEGGEVSGRKAVGAWLSRRGLRPRFFLCSQICHDGWNEVEQRPIDRFSPQAVLEDISTDLDLLATEYLDLVYFDDRPGVSFEPVIEAFAAEVRGGRVRAFGLRNCPAGRIRAIQQYAANLQLPGASAVFTTELALAKAIGPLWPEYIPFDSQLMDTVHSLGIAVFAHADGINLGQCLYHRDNGAEPANSRWVRRWQHPENPRLIERVQSFAGERRLTPREINVAWMLNQNIHVMAVVASHELLAHAAEYERASQLLLNQTDLKLITG